MAQILPVAAVPLLLSATDAGLLKRHVFTVEAENRYKLKAMTMAEYSLNEAIELFGEQYAQVFLGSSTAGCDLNVSECHAFIRQEIWYLP